MGRQSGLRRKRVLEGMAMQQRVILASGEVLWAKKLGPAKRERQTPDIIDSTLILTPIP